MTTEPRFDIAISFLSRDLKLAEAIRDQLVPGLTCFVYSRHQEDVAGTDGLEKFRVMFRHDSRLNVVLYRDGWGQTPWTAVEEKAIEGSALHSRFATLFVVRLEKEAALPLWVPETMINLEFQQYGIAETVGAIRKRAVDLHAHIHYESTLELAHRLAHARGEAKRRADLERSNEGMEQGFRIANETIKAAADIVDTVANSLPTKLAVVRDVREGEGSVTMGGVRCNFFWDQGAVGESGASKLKVDLWQRIRSGHTTEWLPQCANHYFARLSRADEWIWRDSNGRDRSPVELADHWIQEAVRRELTVPATGRVAKAPRSSRGMSEIADIIAGGF